MLQFTGSQSQTRLSDRTELKVEIGLPGLVSGKESDCKAEDARDVMHSIPGSERYPGNPLQYSCLENSMNRGAWWATVQSMGSQRVGHD